MSIRVSVLGSGSRGNATFVATSKVRLLIDCGLPRKTLRERMAAIGEDMERLDAVLVTHEHTDHVAGLQGLLRKQSVEAYMSCGTMEGCRSDAFEMNGSAIVPVVQGRSYPIRDVVVEVFAVPHDAEEPVAYAIHHEGIKVTQLTDLGWIPDHVADSVKGSDVLILESNHDLDMLRMGPYPWNLKERLMGRRGHLSNAAVARFLGGSYDGRARHIVLAHLSSRNNHPELARQAAVEVLRDRGCETRLTLAAQEAPGPVLEMG
jgi:phosphoribosyl 1,2-cyclic phosphodiesterase